MTADVEALTEIPLLEFGLGRSTAMRLSEAMAEMLPKTLRIVAELEERGFVITEKEAS